MTSVLPQRVGVVGGSLGGLFHAVGLHRLGVDVTVWERSTARPEDRGAGIVLQPTVGSFLCRFCHVDPTNVSVEVSHRQFLDRDGTAKLASSPQRMISWGVIYNALRATFPEDRYRSGAPVRSLRSTETEAVVEFDASSETVDLVIVADGTASSLRTLVTDDPAPTYAGYVAYRGVVAEAELTEELARTFTDRFTFFDAPGTQFLCYFIPGDGGIVQPGRRRLNWVWYVPADPDRLLQITTDGNDRHHGLSLPPGAMHPTVHDELLTLARRTLPPQCVELVQATIQPFAQGIQDGAVSTMRNGRILLSGDAAFTVRPHTAASTDKAAGDAVTLMSALTHGSSLESALATWEDQRLREGRSLHDYGIGLGNRFGFTTPLVDGEGIGR